MSLRYGVKRSFADNTFAVVRGKLLEELAHVHAFKFRSL
jgi:hypothetical protein